MAGEKTLLQDETNYWHIASLFEVYAATTTPAEMDEWETGTAFSVKPFNISQGIHFHVFGDSFTLVLWNIFSKYCEK